MMQNTTTVNPVIEESWKNILINDFSAAYFMELKNFLTEEKKKYNIFPPGSKIFEAFNTTPFNDVKVVILGQDPYHGKGQAHGLCFSVPEDVPHPPSLVNIFKELHTDTGAKIPQSGSLVKWARQGVLLLNATLTVRENQAGSHQNKGWEIFTDAVIRALSDKREGLVFMLWGNYAIAKESMIDTGKHFILKAPHPSPLSASRGFFGCRHFSKVNEILAGKGKTPIAWAIEN